ncbi:MAG: outer membrane beta-barrel protein [Bacteroidales bacterium]|nr:outer membrane beta-barrel protein [Bacteroidales bacterium]MCM1147933.1 outer membrane beta-barrel protein [Bacteroidales bacterium]MCM1205482.1 outer membrane beta-barrel protein [Bacillota bacterium]MCM1509256.1 outer membrane beta-barrel protein [Clostridium sp.]
MNKYLIAVLLISYPFSAIAQTNNKTSQEMKDTMRIDKNVELGEVVVKSQRQLIKNEIDRTTYNVQADEESKVKTVMDMLRKVPLVTVDGQDNIKVNGSSSFKIFKNGRPDPTMTNNAKEVLKAMPASMVKRIEVITEPGARYDAEGVSAILNIVMMDHSRLGGVVGSVGADMNDRFDPGINGYITTQAGKFIVSANYGYRHQGAVVSASGNESETYYKDSGNTMRTMGHNDNRGEINYGNVEASLDIDTLNLISLSMSGFGYNIGSNSYSNTQMHDQLGHSIYSYSSKGKSDNNFSFLDFSTRLDYQHKTRIKDEILTFSYLLSLRRNKNNQGYEYSDATNLPVGYTGYDSFARQTFAEHTFQADWVRPFAKYHKLETGAKYIYRHNNSDNSQTFNNGIGTTSTLFSHDTHIGALYLQYILNAGRWACMAGLRYEYSHMAAEYPDGSAESFSRTISDLVPSMTVKYRLSDSDNLKLSYSAGISRPGISYLNPAVVEDVTSISYGNGSLNSARKHDIVLTFQHTGAKFTFNIRPYFRYSNSEIGNVIFTEGDKIVRTYANAQKSVSYGTKFYFQWAITESTSFSFNGQAGNSSYENDILQLKLRRWSSWNYGNLRQKLPWKLNLTVGGGFDIGKSPDNVYGYSSPYKYYYLSLQRSFLKEDRLTVNLSANNPFGNKYYDFKSCVIQGDYLSESHFYQRRRSCYLSVSYRFGKLNASVKKAARSINNDDLEGGVSKK